MAKSKAKKLREKLVREGKRDPELSRGIYALADMRTRITKTKTEKLNQVKHKKRLSNHYDGDGINACFIFRLFPQESPPSLQSTGLLHVQKQ